VFDARVKLRVLIVVAVFVVVVHATVVAMVAVAVDVSDAAVVRAGRQRVGGVMVEGVVGVARARAARVDERRPVRALDEVAARVDACQQGVEPLVEWVVAVR